MTTQSAIHRGSTTKQNMGLEQFGICNLIGVVAVLMVVCGADASQGTGLRWNRTRCGPFDLLTRWGRDMLEDGRFGFEVFGYPRPQLRRCTSTAREVCLNGIWEFQVAEKTQVPVFGKSLPHHILVPFPVESCLSGAADMWTEDSEYYWYRSRFSGKGWNGQGRRTLLHFGAVDWRCDVYINGIWVGSHEGGYDSFDFDITAAIQGIENEEIFVVVYDPTDRGEQPFGKQRASAARKPGGILYTSSSGIWQTVWLSNVEETYITDIELKTSLDGVDVFVKTNCGTSSIMVVTVWTNEDGVILSEDHHVANLWFRLGLENQKLWSLEDPFLYQMNITIKGKDKVQTYFGLREIGGEISGHFLMNGERTTLFGVLDQSWWPDGQYLAPGDQALEFDLWATKYLFGFNAIRVHQKMNPKRWYYHADRLGIAILQDIPQHYSDHFATPSATSYYHDAQSVVESLRNHPSVVQWVAFNEDNMHEHFNVKSVVDTLRSFDSSRPINADSGGKANSLHVGDVDDIHVYPFPVQAKGRFGEHTRQLKMLGEFGGIGLFSNDHSWARGCFAYETANSSMEFTENYLKMVNQLDELRRSSNVSIAIYTQLTDVELECDGFLNYDRTEKFTKRDLERMREANRRFIVGEEQREISPATVF